MPRRKPQVITKKKAGRRPIAASERAQKAKDIQLAVRFSETEIELLKSLCGLDPTGSIGLATLIRRLTSTGAARALAELRALEGEISMLQAQIAKAKSEPEKHDLRVQLMGADGRRRMLIASTLYSFGVSSYEGLNVFNVNEIYAAPVPGSVPASELPTKEALLKDLQLKMKEGKQ